MKKRRKPVVQVQGQLSFFNENPRPAAPAPVIAVPPPPVPVVVITRPPFSSPIERLGRANKILEFLKYMGFSNMGLGALSASGSRTYVDIHGGTPPTEIVAKVCRFANLAERAAKRACEICEYADRCSLKGRLYERLSAPEPEIAGIRDTLRTRMNAVKKSNGQKTMNCLYAIDVFRPKKADWDYAPNTGKIQEGSDRLEKAQKSIDRRRHGANSL